MHIAYIALGSNQHSHFGGPAATLLAAVDRLASLGRVAARSSLYSTEPVGFAGQPRFVNAVVALETGLSPRTLLHRLLELERDFGRSRTAGIVNRPRTLDLDILMVGHLVLHEAGLVLPHPRMTERGFVLVPLAEIAPEVVDPRSRQSISSLLEALRATHPLLSEQVVRLENQLWDLGR